MPPFKADPHQVCEEPRHRYGYRLRRGNSPVALQLTMVTLRAALTPEAMPTVQGANPVQGLHSASI